VGSYRDILWENAGAADIAIAKHCAPTQEGFVRYQALELLREGYTREQVARISDRSPRTVRHWLQLFRDRGLDGLALKGRSGRPRKIDADKFRCEYVPLILEPERVGETHWTALKFHGHLKDKFKEELGYSTLVRYLEENDVALRYPRRWPERQDAEKRKEFLCKLRKLSADRQNAIWFCDQAGFEGDPRPRRVWVKKGSKPKVPYLGDHIRHNVVGAVNPKHGELFSLVVPHCDKDVFQVFLDEFAKHTAKKNQKKRIILVLDNASWHRHSELKWHHITPCYLPSYSPDFNPIEEIWRVLKERFFTNWIAKSIEQLIDRICQAIKSLLKDDIASIAAMEHLLTK
jgi:transposase